MLHRLPCLLFMFVSCSLWAWQPTQAVYQPITVNLDTVTDQSFPPAYFSSRNHYIITSSISIDSITSADTLFTVQYLDKGHYVLNYNYMLRGPIRFGQVSAIPLKVYFKEGKVRTINVRYIFFAPVAITYTDTLGHKLTPVKGTVHYGGKITACARWAVPAYVEEGTRIRGMFTINFFCNMIKVSSITGWHDTGDCTRPFDLASLAPCSNNRIKAVIDVTTLKTYYTERMGIETMDGHLTLDKNTPAETIFVLN